MRSLAIACAALTIFLPKILEPDLNFGLIVSSGRPILVIPKLKLAAPIINPASPDEPDIQKALEEGVAHYPETAEPGELGNMYILGHSSDNPWAKGRFKQVFAGLPNLEIGDEIIAKNSTGQSFRYQVIKKKIVSAADLSALNQPSDRKLLTLQTSYPIGTSFKRLIVIAKLE